MYIHMLSFSNDFDNWSFVYKTCIVEVTDGNTILINMCDTIKLNIFVDDGTCVLLTLDIILYVPDRLFSPISLIEQWHNIQLLYNQGIQIYINGIASSVILPSHTISQALCIISCVI